MLVTYFIIGIAISILLLWVVLILINIVHLLETLTNSITMFCSVLCRKFKLTVGDFTNEKEEKDKAQS